ncbi:MAG: hypothetical protein EOR77_21420 [Mesorhizobium sp.]|uniref:hypothetical protein n=1 Tax=Mesorhizobium sp. TaxID=1871066 RepID=UPI000FE6E423|nr:hypothetical protein [Mesorhizobium sp.]RWM32593.1 MAG: hypothetical protein EOR77_21420 [Mesorhizobium sp.]
MAGTKILPDHYQHMKEAIAKVAITHKVDAHRQFIVNENKSKDVEKRLRWDLAYYAGLTPWICDNIYPYANDDHLDTALRSIMKELIA